MRAALLAAAVAAVLAWPPRARAAGAPDPRRVEAAERFDRAMALLKEGDDATALAELRLVYVLAPHPQVLYNLGLVYAALNRPVEAVRALDEVLAAPGALPAASLDRARRTRDEQARHVARLDVTTNVPAAVAVDGVEVGTTPLDGPVAVAAGTHVVAAVGSGYRPVRREITVAGETKQPLRLELAPGALPLAHLAVRAVIPDADVLVDGQHVGRTPLPAALAVTPGRRVIELRRAGYRPARREVALDDGAAGEVSLDLVEDAAAAGAARGRLVLAVSEPDSDVTVDGQARGAYRGPLSLPPGAHRLRVARAGFLTAERLVTVPAGAEVVARVTLAPTPETRAAYGHRAATRRRWGWAGVLGGLAIGAGAATVVALNRGPLRDASANIDQIVSQPPCLDAQSHDQSVVKQCAALLDAADDRFNTHQTIQNVGLVALVAGVLAAGTGAALLLTADDPARYDRAPRDLDGPALSGWLAPAGCDGLAAGGLAVAGRF